MLAGGKWACDISTMASARSFCHSKFVLFDRDHDRANVGHLPPVLWRHTITTISKSPTSFAFPENNSHPPIDGQQSLSFAVRSPLQENLSALLSPGSDAVDLPFKQLRYLISCIYCGPPGSEPPSPKFDCQCAWAYLPIRDLPPFHDKVPYRKLNGLRESMHTKAKTRT